MAGNAIHADGLSTVLSAELEDVEFGKQPLQFPDEDLMLLLVV